MTINTQTPLQMVISRHEKRIGCPFVPTRNQFYNVVGINQKRFGMLLRGQLPIYGFEAISLAKFFEIEVTEILDEPKPTQEIEKNMASPFNPANLGDEDQKLFIEVTELTAKLLQMKKKWSAKREAGTITKWNREILLAGLTAMREEITSITSELIIENQIATCRK